MLDAVEAVARAAALAGGSALAERYADGDTEGEYSAHDVKAAADVASEARMLPVVRQAFPDHAVFSEEAGEFEGTEYRWVLDPLDGTNNFTAGLATFSAAVAVLRAGDPMLAVVHLPATQETYVARRGDGVRYQNEYVNAESDVPTEAGTVATIIGREVPNDQERMAVARAIDDAVEERVKRVVRSWAPTVHASLLARGRLQGLVQFHPNEEEQAVTELLAEESGAAIRRHGPLFVAAGDETTLEVLWDAASGVR